MTGNPITCNILFKVVPTSQRKNVRNRGRHKTSMEIQLGSGVAKSKRDWTDTSLLLHDWSTRAAAP